MFSVASEESYQDGQIIFKEGSSGDWVYVIISGTVEISKMVKGNKFVVELLPEGEVFGELGFLEGIKRTATATAVGKTTIGLIERESLDAEFNRLSSNFRAIIKAIVKRAKKLLDKAYEQ
ncbi:cyclic nucleotide-binding domain-containing protein [Thermodesulfobacteriota bacterium]